MRVTFPGRPLRIALAVLAVSVIDACHGPSPFQVYGAPSRSFSVAVGEEMTIQIGGVGPGYASPPTLTGSTLEFLDVTDPPGALHNPGGEPQLFHFKGVATGQTIILFQGQGAPPNIVDTVNVR